MNPARFLALVAWLVCTASAHAQLTVTVSPPKIAGSKAIVPLVMKNNLSEKVESARAVVFLLDEQGKMTGQATRWVIGGGPEKLGLEPSATNIFNFVITSPGSSRFTTTNLTVKVSFSRVVLEGGKVADPNNDVKILK